MMFYLRNVSIPVCIVTAGGTNLSATGGSNAVAHGATTDVLKAGEVL